MLQFSMKESNNNPIRIESFPCDDKTYVITGYGGFIKNYYTAIDIPLVNVQMGLVENDYLVKNILTCIVGLPELSIVRIGTIWKNQVRQDSYWNKYALYEEQIPLSFNLEKIPAKCIIYKKNDSDKKNLQECNIEDLHSKNSLEFDYDENYYASTFVKFTTKDGISYIVPSIELLMSTYLPRNKLIRNELILNPMNTLLQSYILDYSCTEDEYNIELDKALEKETMVFLAYMMCDKKSKGNISKIWTSLENTHSSGLKYPFILPYHPKNISFRVSGIWIKDKLFYVQRIYEPEAPNEIRVNIKCTRTISTNDKYEENEVEDLGDGNNKDKPLNTNPINKPVNITPRDNPGGNVGVKHIVSEVSPNNNQLNCDVDEEVVIIKNENNNKYKKTDVEVDGASSGKLSGKEGSKRIARTIYTVEENPKEIIYIKEVTDALEILKNNGTFTEFFYIDDWANKHVNLVYSSFHYHHIDINDNKNWASAYTKSSGVKKSEAGYRKLLIVTFKIEGKRPLYLIEIIRKVKSDSFYGIIFQPNEELSFSKLEEIKYIIASNKGQFRSKESIPFPIKKIIVYRHTGGKMLQRFENLNEIIKNTKTILD